MKSFANNIQFNGGVQLNFLKQLCRFYSIERRPRPRRQGSADMEHRLRFGGERSHFSFYFGFRFSAELMPFIKCSRFGMRSERDNLNFNSPNKLVEASTSSQNGLVLGKKDWSPKRSRSCVGLEHTRQKVVESQLSLRDRDADSHASTVLNDFTLSTRNSSRTAFSPINQAKQNESERTSAAEASHQLFSRSSQYHV